MCCAISCCLCIGVNVDGYYKTFRSEQIFSDVTVDSNPSIVLKATSTLNITTFTRTNPNDFVNRFAFPLISSTIFFAVVNSVLIFR